MARLPQVGGDSGNWGTVLNDFLSQAHNSDGTLKPVSSAELASGSVTQSKLSVSGTATSGKVLSTTGTGLAWTTVSTGTTPDATSSTKGVVQLAGDLGGTAAAPTVPGLASKYSKPAGGIPSTDLTASVQTSLGKANSSVQSVNGKTGSSVTLAAADVGAASTLDELSDVSAAGATDGQSLVFTAGTWGPATVASGSPAVTDATSTAKGVIQLAGDLGGTAAAPTVPGLSGKLDSSKVGAVNGVASLDGTGKVPSSQLPTTTAPVTSVAGKTGDVTLAESDVTNLTTDLSSKVAKSTATAKGDLLAATGSATIARLGVGTDGQVLTADSSQTAGVKWATPSTGSSGNGSRQTVAKTANYTASAGDYVIADATTSGFTVTLPTPANGAWVSVKKIDSTVNAILVQAQNSASIKIDDQTSVSVNSQWMDADFISDGTKWFRVG